MFFFIGGIQPRTTDCDNQYRMCPSCGLYQAKLKRIDNYLSIFFIPVLRIKKGEPFLLCERCGFTGQPPDMEKQLFNNEKQVRCTNCGRFIENGFKFCPFCGEKI